MAKIIICRARACRRMVVPVNDAMAETTGLVLAGGRSTRMGGEDKGLVGIAGKPMAVHVIEALRPQVAALLINANRNQDSYRAFGWPVIADGEQGFLGPLAGMASGLLAATTPLVATVPCDSPFVPGDLVARLHAGLRAQHADIAVAHDGQRLQPVFCLLHTSLHDSINQFLAGGDRKIDRWFALHRMAVVDFEDRLETFRNVNTPTERAEAEAQLAPPSTEGGGTP